MILKRTLLPLLTICFMHAATAQTSNIGQKADRKTAQRERINRLIRQEEEGETVFHKQSVFGIGLISDGYGFSYEFGKFINNKKTLLFQFDFNEKKSPKEKKLPLVTNSGSTSLIIGKTNYFYQARLGAAQQRRLGGKDNKNGVSVATVLGGGLSMGLLRPYYVDALIDGEVDKSTFPTIMDSAYQVGGSSGITTGWKEIKVNPGAYGKAAMRFDYGRFNESVAAIEIGVTAEYYSKKVSQMAYAEQKQFFFSSYISLLFGSRK